MLYPCIIEWTLVKSDGTTIEERWIRKLPTYQWSIAQEEKLCALSPKYRKSYHNEAFWVLKSLIPPNTNAVIKQNANRDTESRNDLWNCSCILGVLTNAELAHLFQTRKKLNLFFIIKLREITPE